MNIIDLECLPATSQHPPSLAVGHILKTCCSQEIKSWIKNRPGHFVTAYKDGMIFWKVYTKTDIVEVAYNGLKSQEYMYFLSTDASSVIVILEPRARRKVV